MTSDRSWPAKARLGSRAKLRGRRQQRTVSGSRTEARGLIGRSPSRSGAQSPRRRSTLLSRPPRSAGQPKNWLVPHAISRGRSFARRGLGGPAPRIAHAASARSRRVLVRAARSAGKSPERQPPRPSQSTNWGASRRVGRTAIRPMDSSAGLWDKALNSECLPELWMDRIDPRKFRPQHVLPGRRDPVGCITVMAVVGPGPRYHFQVIE